jgi:hypothetical protein
MIAINCCGIARPNEKGTPMTSEGNSKTQWHKDKGEGWLKSYSMER